MQQEKSFGEDFVVFKSEKDSCSLRVIPSCNYVLKGKTNVLQVLFQIKTGEIKDDKENTLQRPPVELALVLDRSGSMAGQKLEHAKNTIIKVIENLSQQDRVHFIIYDYETEIIFENGDLTNKDLLFHKINSINARGATNIGAALDTAWKVLSKNGKSDIQSRRIFLFSDGLVNQGLRIPQEIFELTIKIQKDKISTSTFGIGLDFDEDLMKGIAECGQSDYFYIEKPESINLYVSAALGALLGTIGKEACLKPQGVNNSILKLIYGYNDLTKGAIIGDIKQNNLMNILVELEVSPKEVKEEEEVMSYNFSYIPRNESKSIEINGILKLSSVEDENMLEEKNMEAIVALTIKKSAEIDERIVQLLQKNQIRTAREEKKKDIEMLLQIEPKDPTGRVTALRERGERFLKDLRLKNTRHLLKSAKFNSGLKRFDSSDWVILK